jgi:hypothetical protein
MSKKSENQTGNTLRNRYYQTRDKNRELTIKRTKSNDLTIFDVNFNIIPETPSSHIRDLSQTKYSDMREYLESNSIYKKSYKYYTVYHIPVIGTFDKYDSVKDKYIYTESDSTPVNLVIYEVYNDYTSDYYPEKNPHKKLYELSDKSHKKMHFGRKFNKTRIVI